MKFPIVARPIGTTSISQGEVIQVTPLSDGAAAPWVEVGKEKHFRVRLHLRVHSIAAENLQGQARVHAALRVRPVRRLKRAIHRQAAARHTKSPPHRSSADTQTLEPSTRKRGGARPERSRRRKPRSCEESTLVPADADATILGASRSASCAERASFASTSATRVCSDIERSDHSSMVYRMFNPAAVRYEMQPSLMPSNYIRSFAHAAQPTSANQFLPPAPYNPFARPASAFSPIHSSNVGSIPLVQSMGAGCLFGPGCPNLHAASAMCIDSWAPNHTGHFPSGYCLPPSSYPVPPNMSSAVPINPALLQYYYGTLIPPPSMPGRFGWRDVYS